MRNRKFFVCVCLFTMNILGLSACGDPGSSPPDSHAFLSADSDGVSDHELIADKTESPLDVIGTANTILNEQLQSDTGEEELVFVRVTAEDPKRPDNRVTVTSGVIDNEIHQRVSRPYLHGGPSEPFKYREEFEASYGLDGAIVKTHRILKSTNRSPSTFEERAEPPQVDARLQKVIESAPDLSELVDVRLKPRWVPQYDKPLPARTGADIAEVIEVDLSRDQWTQDREALMERVLQPWIEELETLDATSISIVGVNGWIQAKVPVGSLQSLFDDDRLVAVMSPPRRGSDNACIMNCTDTDYFNANHIRDREWYLGDGSGLNRLGSFSFLRQGFDGSYDNLYRHSFGALVAGIAEYGKYEDEGLFETDNQYGRRIVQKYKCHYRCTQYFLGICVGWGTVCDSQSNLDDYETLMCWASGNSTDDNWNHGCHGTPVASILLGNFPKTLMNQYSYLTVADPCFDPASNATRCDSFFEKTMGNAPAAKGIFFWMNNDGDPDGIEEAKAYQKAKDLRVDVLNMSHGSTCCDSAGDRCKVALALGRLDELENAFDDGVFLVNSTGNYGSNEWLSGYRRYYYDNDCMLNELSSRPKVFSVGAIQNQIYRYSNYFLSIPGEPSQDAWQLTNSVSTYSTQTSAHPVNSDDYRNMRLDPIGSQTGGGDLRIKNESGISVTRYRAMTGVDLLAPRGAQNNSSANGAFGSIFSASETLFFGGSSGAAPHVSGLALLVKHWLHSSTGGASWVNEPGWIHTFMLAMGDRSWFDENSMKHYHRLVGGDINYGFGRVKLRLLNHAEAPVSRYKIIPDSFNNEGGFPASGYKAYPVFNWKAPSETTFLKCVMNQIEDMNGKASDDQVSDFKFAVYYTNATYASTCPSTWEAACPNADSNGNSPYCTKRDDISYDIKKMVAFENLTAPYLTGRCYYVRLQKRRITPQGVGIQMLCYDSQLPDWSGSSGHTCAVRNEGLFNQRGYCWGNNDQGQLGDGTVNHHFTPTQFTGTGQGLVVKMTAGGGHTCIISSFNGYTYCWGRNDHGQIGNNTTQNARSPQGIGLSLGLDVSAGFLHTCAIRRPTLGSSIGSLWCWGSNRYGQLGTGDVIDRLVPTEISVGTQFKQVSAGKFHTCAIRNDDQIMCWGLNDVGQTGRSSYGVLPSPSTIFGTNTYSLVSSGSTHTCAIRISNSRAYCWGENRNLQTGGTGDFSYYPTEVLVGVSSVGAGGVHSCAVKTDGTVWCWGDNRYGQLGNNSTTGSIVPVQVSSLAGVTSLSIGKNHHSCAIVSGGEIKCWGQNDNGQLGNGSVSLTGQLTPVTVPGTSSYTSIDCGN